MSVIAPGRNIVLVGLMGTGKTTVGALLAARLGRTLVDIDALVEQGARRSVAEIFADEGERGFRRREAEAVRSAAALRGRVIAVGGGAVTEPANVTQLRATGDIVLLDGDPEVLAARLVAGDVRARPLLAGSQDPAGRLAALREERDAAYRGAAATAVDTTALRPEEVAEEVLVWARTVPGLLAREEREAPTVGEVGEGWEASPG